MPSDSTCHKSRIYQVKRLSLEVKLLIQISDFQQHVLSVVTSHLQYDVNTGYLPPLSVDQK